LTSFVRIILESDHQKGFSLYVFALLGELAKSTAVLKDIELIVSREIGIPFVLRRLISSPFHPHTLFTHALSLSTMSPPTVEDDAKEAIKILAELSIDLDMISTALVTSRSALPEDLHVCLLSPRLITFLYHSPLP
jgi:hypothetical protein